MLWIKEILKLFTETPFPVSSLIIGAILLILSIYNIQINENKISSQINTNPHLIFFVPGLVLVGSAVFSLVKNTKNEQETPTSIASPSHRGKVFVSAPMAAFPNNRQEQTNNQEICDILEAISNECELDTFYAGKLIKEKKNYDPPSQALRINFQEMESSDKFIMIYPEKLPSSILVEAGMAIGLGKDSIFFVKKDKELPFLLQQASNAPDSSNNLPKIRIIKYDSVEQILTWIKTQKTNLFE